MGEISREDIARIIDPMFRDALALSLNERRTEQALAKADAFLACLAAKDEAEPVASSADTANKPLVWMNFEHLEAYREGKRDGVAWAAPERSDFYSVALYTTAPKAEAPTAAKDEAEPVASPQEVQEACAQVAERHKGSYTRRTSYKTSIKFASEEALAEIRAEERGEDIAAEMIAKSIRALIPPTVAKDEARERVIEELARKNRQIDKYGLALMMISQGCADHVGVANKALAKSWACKACGWQGEMPNTKILPDAMGYAQTPCCPDCDQHAAIALSPSNPTRMQGEEE